MNKQYGNVLKQHINGHQPKPVFVDTTINPDADCPNCSDRGFITAFFCDYTQSVAVNEHPHPGKGQVMAWIQKDADSEGAWWLGHHRTYPCPVCRTQIVYHDGGGRMRR